MKRSLGKKKARSLQFLDRQDYFENTRKNIVEGYTCYVSIRKLVHFYYVFYIERTHTQDSRNATIKNIQKKVASTLNMSTFLIIS